MSVHANETIIRNLFTAFNSRKFDDARKLVSDKFEWQNVATGEVFKGPEGCRRYMESWASAFRDGKAEILRVITTDDYAVTELLAKGTHTGTLETPTGPVAPTERKVELRLCEVARIENGKILSGSTYFDSATLLSQLGAMELAGAHK